MATREELVEHLWQAVINPLRDPGWMDNVIANCRRAPDDSFAAAGPAIERVLAAGVSPRDLCLITHLTAYEAVFGTLYALGAIRVSTVTTCSACTRIWLARRVPTSVRRGNAHFIGSARHAATSTLQSR